MIDFRMETFLKVCETMNFTRAAEQLHITQPAVSQHIKFLENHYNQKLFNYIGKKLELTEPGKMLYKAGITIHNDEKYLKARMSSKTDKTWNLSFGATLTIGEFIMPSVFHYFLKKFPNANISLVIENTDILLKKLAKNEINFAFIEGSFNKENYSYLSYSSERFIPVCSGLHKFNKQTKQIKDLLSENIIVRESGSGTRNILEKQLSSSNIAINDFHKIIEVNSMTAIKDMAKNDIGITFLYEAAVKSELLAGELQEIKLKDFSVFHDFNFIWNKNSIFTKDYSEICEGLKQRSII